ncbi:MAG: hypothetical protein Q8M22_07625 [Actinomycetota bacterium]|nr:hypothetical protein [Actinomycetota bacterium]
MTIDHATTDHTTTDHTTIRVQPTASGESERSHAVLRLLLGAATIPLALAGLARLGEAADDAAPPERSQAEITGDLVNRGLIPRQALDPAPRSQDALRRELVSRGLIPRETLEAAPTAPHDGRTAGGQS